MQRLGAATCYFLFDIALAIPFLIYRWGKVVQKRRKEFQKTKVDDSGPDTPHTTP